MKLIDKKLRSNSGATLIIAIVFMMFCVFIGGSVLAAATANGARANKAFASEQEYLSLRSAALLMTEELRAGSDGVTGMTIANNEGRLTYSLENRRNDLRELMYLCAGRRYCEQRKELTGTNVTDANHIAFVNLGTNYGPATYPGITVDGSGNTRYDFEIKVDKGGEQMETVTVRMQCAPDYSVRILFSLDGGENFSSALHLEMKATLIGTDTTSIIWADPVIIKGGA